MICYATCYFCNGSGRNEIDLPCEFCNGAGEVPVHEDDQDDDDAEDDECPTD